MTDGRFDQPVTCSPGCQVGAPERGCRCPPYGVTLVYVDSGKPSSLAPPARRRGQSRHTGTARSLLMAGLELDGQMTRKVRFALETRNGRVPDTSMNEAGAKGHPSTTLRCMSQAPSPRRTPKATPRKRQSSQPSKQDMAIEAMRLKYQVIVRLVDGFRVGIWIISSFVPLTIIEKISRNIAGKQTNFSASVSVSIAISILLSVGWAITARRSHERKKEVDRLRSRNDKLEHGFLTQRQAPAAESLNQSDSASEETSR